MGIISFNSPFFFFLPEALYPILYIEFLGLHCLDIPSRETTVRIMIEWKPSTAILSGHPASHEGYIPPTKSLLPASDWIWRGYWSKAVSGQCGTCLMSTFYSGAVSEFLRATVQFEVLPTQSCFLLPLLSQGPDLHCCLQALLPTYALFCLS